MRISAGSPTSIDGIIAHTKVPEGLTVTLRGMVQGMRASFRSFALGSVSPWCCCYLILVAQFRSFVDPFIILIAVPPGLTGVMLTLLLYGHHVERHVADGRRHAGRHRGIEQHSDCRIHAPPARRRNGRARSRGDGVPRAIAPGADDVARHHHRSVADGAETRRRQRILRSARARDSGRPDGLGSANGIPGARRLRLGVG